MGKEKIIPIFALLILLIGSMSALYVYATTTNATTLTINGASYTINQLFSMGKQKSFEADGKIYTGVALDDLIIKTGVRNSESHTYTFIGNDGFQKTVKWDNMKNGLLTKEGQSIFSDLPKAFRVKNIVAIEVE